MNYRILGRTGLRVSEIGLGALEIGRNWPYWRSAMDDFRKPLKRDAIDLVHQAIDMGINFIDTAPAYVDSEELLGKALKGKRDKVILATKCGEWFDDVKSVYDYSASETLRFIESSLKKLQTDRIDLLQIHSGSEEVVRRGETLSAMKKAQSDGKVRFLGISLDTEEAALAALETGGYDCLQLSYNLIFRKMEAHVLPEAKRQNIGIIVKDGLAAGRLTAKYTTLADGLLMKQIEAFELKANRIGISLSEYAIRFLLGNSSISTVILGTKDPRHLNSNVVSSNNPALSLRIFEGEASTQFPS